MDPTALTYVAIGIGGAAGLLAISPIGSLRRLFSAVAILCAIFTVVVGAGAPAARTTQGFTFFAAVLGLLGVGGLLLGARARRHDRQAV